MTNLCILYVAAVVLPVLFHSWRVAVLALGVQGFLLALILTGHESFSWAVAFEVTSLLLIRAVFIPWYLHYRMRGSDTTRAFSLISKNLLQWILTFGLLAIAFLFGRTMSPDDPHEALQVGTATVSILIGLQILANQNHPLGQIIGLFTFEGGVTLVELLSSHAMPFPISVGVSLVTVIFVLVCGEYLTRIIAIDPEGKSVASKEA
jgi:hydrogenase-4 membrane subunit HyfE